MMDGGQPPAAEQAYQTLRDRIMSGDLAAGSRLVERTLAVELNLSRTPVREAITRLIHEGFVERGEGYSTRVASFPEAELDQIFEIRRRLESYAARLAADFASDAQIDELDALTTRMEALTPPQTPQDYADIADINARFHRIIYEATQSPRLVSILQLSVDIGVVSRTYFSYSEEALIRSARHHRELVAALRARSPEWAENVMSAHIMAAAATALSSVDKPAKSKF